jgi:uncharacterized protein YraI
MATGWSTATGGSADAAATTTSTTSTAHASRQAASCGYRLSRVRRAGYLNVRSGPGLGYRRVGKLRAADGRVTGACQPKRRWVAVNSARGKAGWSSARYLRKVN